MDYDSFYMDNKLTFKYRDWYVSFNGHSYIVPIDDYDATFNTEKEAEAFIDKCIEKQNKEINGEE